MLKEIALPMNPKRFGGAFFPFAHNRLNAFPVVREQKKEVDVIRPHDIQKKERFRACMLPGAVEALVPSACSLSWAVGTTAPTAL
jgi:hypothetical protein